MRKKMIFLYMMCTKLYSVYVQKSTMMDFEGLRVHKNGRCRLWIPIGNLYGFYPATIQSVTRVTVQRREKYTVVSNLGTHTLFYADVIL